MDRISYPKANPDAYRAMLTLADHVRGGSLPSNLRHLVYLRVSQINGCAFCVDMHAKDLRAGGETSERLDGLCVWREMPGYTAGERAALAWAEAVTRLGPDGVSDEVYAAAHAEFGDAGLVELTLAVAVINAWNRLGIAFRSPAGHYKAKAR